MLKRNLPIWLLVFYSFLGQSQTFNILPPQKINTPSGSEFGSICWGDYDNDNDLDFIITGKDTKRTYIGTNLGNDSFSLNTFNLPQINGQAQFADFDNDGDLDIFISGTGLFNNIANIYLNTLPDSIGFIVDSNNTNNFISGTTAIISIVDIDNDGDADIHQSVFYSLPYFLFMDMFYKNQTNNIFSQIIILDTFNYYSKWYNNFSDFNNDGFIDAHRLFGNLISNDNKIYLNKSDFSTQLVPSYSTPASLYIRDYIDFNLDGRIDILCGGLPDSIDSNYFKIYKNHIDSFSLFPISFTGVSNNYNLGKIESMAFDANNDGKYELFLANDTFLYYFKTINNNNFFFDSAFNFNITSIDILSTADYDNDGDLDVFASGWYNTWPYNFTTIFRNDSTPPNTPPTAPQIMWTEMDSTKIIFRWQPATDVETPQATLSYNLMVGTTHKGIDITSPMADTVTGFRRVVALGNAQLNNFYILDKSNFTLGDTIYWSVQTIDNGFGYSPFSKGNSAIVHQSMTLENRTLCSNMDSISWRGQYYNSAGIYFHGNGVITNFDSAFFLQLDTALSYLNLQTANLCAGSSYNWNGQNLMTSGVYQQYYTSAQGCDSIERLVLHIHPDITNVQTADLCLGDSVALGNMWLGAAGVYIDTLQTIFGCDSLVKLTISVSPDDSTVVQSGDSLIAQSSSAQIVWWDCQKQQLVYGVGGQVFVPSYNGHFAAQLTQNGCTYLTRCFEVTGVGIDQNAPQNGSPIIDIWPNPAKDKIFIKSSEYISKVSLIDSYGKIVLELTDLKSKDFEMDISTLANGIYLMKMEWENGVEMRKIVKE